MRRARPRRGSAAWTLRVRPGFKAITGGRVLVCGPGTSTDPPSGVAGPSVRRRTVEMPGQLAQPSYADNLISEAARVMDLPRHLPALQGRFGNGPVTGLTSNDRYPTVTTGNERFTLRQASHTMARASLPMNWLPRSGSGWCGDRQHGAAAVSRRSPCRRGDHRLWSPRTLTSRWLNDCLTTPSSRALSSCAPPPAKTHP